jgi:hypothetical protein
VEEDAQGELERGWKLICSAQKRTRRHEGASTKHVCCIRGRAVLQTLRSRAMVNGVIEFVLVLI